MTALVRGQGWTPLMYAAAAGDLKSVKVLVEGTAKVDARSAQTGVTALMLAAAGGHAETLTALLEYGADLRGRDLAGRSALDYAYLAGHDDLGRDLELRDFKLGLPRPMRARQTLMPVKPPRQTESELEP